MKIIARINAVVIIAILIINMLTIASFADDKKWVQDKPDRLVSYKYHSETHCSECDAEFVDDFEYVLESELNGRTYSGEKHGYAGEGHHTKYDCTGYYYCVSHTIVAYQSGGSILDYTKSQVDHLKTHGKDSNGYKAVLLASAGYCYGEEYKEAEGHYETITSTPTTPSNPSDSESASSTPAQAPGTSVTPAKSSLFGVAITKVIRGKKSFTAKWKKASKKQQKKFTGYQIQYSTSPKFSGWLKTKSTTKKTASKVVIRKLKKKTTYYVRMRRYKKSGGKKIYSEWSKVKVVKTK